MFCLVSICGHINSCTVLRSKNGQEKGERISFDNLRYTRPRYQGNIMHATKCKISFFLFTKDIITHKKYSA